MDETGGSLAAARPGRSGPSPRRPRLPEGSRSHLRYSPARDAIVKATCTALVLFLAAWAAGAALPDPQARELLFALKSGDAEQVDAALARAVEAHDARFVAPLVELLRADELGIARGLDRAALAAALEALSGQHHGEDAAAWTRWYAGSDLEPPPGFTGWKGQLLSRLEPRFGMLLALGVPSRIRTEEIVWGGVPFEGIPALDHPRTVPVAEASWLGDDEPVFGLALGGEARAYPLRILDWHELVNDELAGVPVSLAYCTLCGSGIAFDGRAPDGRSYDFGSSGLLMRSNKLMVDRQTGSLWNQLTGRPVLGPLAAGEDFRLRVLPSVVTTWGRWRALHPDSRVLALDTGYERPYQPGAAYGDYFASADTMFPVRLARRELPAKARVFGLELEGRAVAWPLSRLVAAGVLDDEVGGTALLLLAPDPVVRVRGKSVRSGRENSYAVGTAVRAYRRGAERLRASGEQGVLLDEQGRRWRVSEDALLGPKGQRLARLPGVLAYWFAWAAFHPDTLLRGASGAGP